MGTTERDVTIAKHKHTRFLLPAYGVHILTYKLTPCYLTYIIKLRHAAVARSSAAVSEALSSRWRW